MNPGPDQVALQILSGGPVQSVKVDLVAHPELLFMYQRFLQPRDPDDYDTFEDCARAKLEDTQMLCGHLGHGKPVEGPGSVFYCTLCDTEVEVEPVVPGRWTFTREDFR